MAACPTDRQLQLLVTDELSAAEREPVEGHVECCRLCQANLERLTGPVASPLLGDAGPGGRKNAKERMQASPHLDFLRDLAHTLPSPTETIERTREDVEKVGPSFPAQNTSFPGFELLSVLGQGGMSVVFKARQLDLNRLVALKVLSRFQAGEQELARFRAEAEAIASLRHPSIVQVYEFGENAGHPFFTLELIEGGTLATRLKGQPQDPSTSARFLETVARAVQFAHEHGIIHRDLKPSNILLQSVVSSQHSVVSRKVNNSGQSKSIPPLTDYQLPTTDYSELITDYIPKISDFGLAKQLFVKGEETQSGAILGTPSYMPPEQAQGRLSAKGPAVDIYSLGAILYEMLTGRPPFVGPTPLDTLRQVVQDDPVSVTRLMPGVPRDLETICLKCLHKEPGCRYASALDLAEDLRRFLGQQPIAARPSSVLDRCGKFARRNKSLAGGTLAVILALLAGTIASLMFALGEGRQRERALEEAGAANIARQAADREAYRARLGAALVTLGEHDFQEAQQYLDAAPESLRGWEWQHLHRRLLDEGPAVTRLQRNCGVVQTLLPGGRRLIAQVKKNGPFQMVDTASGTILHELPPGEFAWAGKTHSGSLVAIYSPGEPLYLEDEAGAVRRTSISFGPGYLAFAVNRDGTLLAAARQSTEAECRLEFRDLPSGELRHAVPATNALNHLVRAKAWPSARMAFSRDGKWLGAACADGLVRILDVASGAALAVCRGHTRNVIGVMFRPDGQALLSWGDDGTFRQWRVPDGKAIDVRRGHNRIVYDAAYSEDGQWIFSGSEERAARLWRTSGGDAVAVMRGHTEGAEWVAFHPDGATLVSASMDRTVRFWPLPGQDDPRVLRGPTSFVYPVAFSPDGRCFASGGWDNVVRLWDAASAEPIAVFTAPKAFVASLAFSPDGSRLACRSWDGRLRLWDMRTGVLLNDLEDGGLKDDVQPKGESLSPQNLAISPDGLRMACGFKDRVRFWELATGQELPGLILPVRGAIRHVVFSPDGRQLAIAASEPALCLVSLESGQILHELHGQAALVYAISYSPDGKRLVSAGEDRAVRLWDTATGELQKEMPGHTEQIFAAVFHPNGSRVVTAGRDRVIRIWDTATGAEVARLTGHTDYIFSLAFSPDGRMLISGSGDQTVRLWDTAPLAKLRAARAELRRLRPEAERIVEKLFHEFGDPGKVFDRLRADAELSQLMKRAAWHALLRHAEAAPKVSEPQ